MDLRIFEAKALALALTESGHAVSERTVQRWKRGVTRPKPQDIRAIQLLVGAAPDTTKEPAPAGAGAGDEPPWVARLEAKMDAIANESVTRVISASGVPVEPDRVTGVIERLEALLRLRAEDPPERTGGPDPAEPAPPEQGAG